jgi:hypothetical protein
VHEYVLAQGVKLIKCGLAYRLDVRKNHSRNFGGNIVEKLIKDALEDHGISFGQVVEVDPVESDYLITGVKERESVRVRKSSAQMEGHSVPPGKSIIKRLEELADYHQRRFLTALDYEVEKKLAPSDLPIFIDNYIRGICDALAIMKNSSMLNEYKETVDRVNGERLS